MKHPKIFLFAIILGAALLFLGPLIGFGEYKKVSSQTVSEVKATIAQLEKKIEDAKSQANSLSKEINILDGNIQLTEAKIYQAQLQIEEKEKELDLLKDDIRLLEIRLNRLDETISYHEDLLARRLRKQYMDSQQSYFEILLTSDGLSSFMSKLQYLQRIENQDRELLKVMDDTKHNYEDQTDLLKEKKSKVEDIKREIEVQKAQAETLRASLESQRQQKNILLEQTQNNEAKYQELLAQARAELEAIQNIVNNINFDDGEEVEEGDVIGIMGNSGYPKCSSGAHLHFEVRKNGKVVDPRDYLESKEMYVHHYSSGDMKVGNGDWDWPMKGSITINQLYGKTPWSWRYPSGRHDGLDMKSTDTFIYVPEDGVAAKGTMGCGGPVIKYVAINHGDGVVSYYLHLK